MVAEEVPAVTCRATRGGWGSPPAAPRSDGSVHQQVERPHPVASPNPGSHRDQPGRHPPGSRSPSSLPSPLLEPDALNLTPRALYPHIGAGPHPRPGPRQHPRPPLMFKPGWVGGGDRGHRGSAVPEFVEGNWLIAAWTQGADTKAAHEGVTAIAELGSEQPGPTIGALIKRSPLCGAERAAGPATSTAVDGLDATWPADRRRCR
jgi:hypothetical protein